MHSSAAQLTGQQIIGGFKPSGMPSGPAPPSEPLYSRLMKDETTIGKDRVKFPRVSI